MLMPGSIIGKNPVQIPSLFAVGFSLIPIINLTGNSRPSLPASSLLSRSRFPNKKDTIDGRRFPIETSVDRFLDARPRSR
jgi:hypothetical protein